jgi:predicted dehydrogenase
MTTDETKCQAILDAEKRTGRKVTVTFNYRYASHATRIKELLREKVVGDITSVDFHWYLNCHHGADYFRRWHRLRSKGGTLLVHKATHHFDLVNWWLDTEPEEVFAHGSLDFYGRNHAFRHTTCRGCPHKANCKFSWDITRDKHLMSLYVANEQHDGYQRDGCVWKEDIDIFDKMAVQVKYAGGIQMSYSLTTYSPYEGWRIAFNGTNGRLEAWEDIPWDLGFDTAITQDEHHAKQFDANRKTKKADYDPIIVMKNFQKHELIKVPKAGGGHGGGDPILLADIFSGEKRPDPLGYIAGTRDGAMSVLTGVAARISIDTGKPIRIADLTSLKPARKAV